MGDSRLVPNGRFGGYGHSSHGRIPVSPTHNLQALTHYLQLENPGVKVRAIGGKRPKYIQTVQTWEDGRRMETHHPLEERKPNGEDRRKSRCPSCRRGLCIVLSVRVPNRGAREPFVTVEVNGLTPPLRPKMAATPRELQKLEGKTFLEQRFVANRYGDVEHEVTAVCMRKRAWLRRADPNAGYYAWGTEGLK